MLAEELKPFIDRTYRTLPGAVDTGLGGSSMGGLSALYLGLTYPGIFGRLAVMSPAVWWDHRVVLRLVKELRWRPRLRIWLDVGTAEGRVVVEDVRALHRALRRAGGATTSTSPTGRRRARRTPKWPGRGASSPC